MTDKKWLAVFLTLTLALLAAIAALTIYVDPLLHYHPPRTDLLFYTMDNERSFGSGILKNMSYDALITGTSMAENFKTSEMDSLFGTNAVKVTYAAGSYYEINKSVVYAAERNPDLRLVIRCLDLGGIIDDPERMAVTGSEYPEYLYDDLLLNDVNYLLNKDVFIHRVYGMLSSKLYHVLKGKEDKTGITSFDEYANWTEGHGYVYGSEQLCRSFKGEPNEKGEAVAFTPEDRVKALENLRNNVTSVARQYPDIEFIYYISPYSAVFWQNKRYEGELDRVLEAERLLIEELLKYPNIKLYSFNDCPEITCDLNNYMDTIHYGEWINSLILYKISRGEGLLSEDNYQEYLEAEARLYKSYDYASLLTQPDYADDMEAARLCYEGMAD